MFRFLYAIYVIGEDGVDPFPVIPVPDGKKKGLVPLP